MVGGVITGGGKTSGVVVTPEGTSAGGKICSTIWNANLVSAVIFGLLHALTLTYSILAACMGLYFGVVWLATGNMLVPVAAHAIYDFIALLYFLRMRKSPNEEPQNIGSV